MLQVYAYKPDDLVDNNDLLFERKSYARIIQEPMDGILHRTISRVEQVDFLEKDRIYSKITNQPISLSEISTGCKIVVNMMLWPEYTLFIYECGENYIHELYRLPYGKIYSFEFIEPKYPQGLENKEFEGILAESKTMILHGLEELQVWYWDYVEL